MTFWQKVDFLISNGALELATIRHLINEEDGINEDKGREAKSENKTNKRGSSFILWVRVVS